MISIIGTLTHFLKDNAVSYDLRKRTEEDG